MKLFTLIGLFLAPFLTFAHTKWFAESELTKLPQDQNFYLYLAVFGIIGTLITVAAIEFHQMNKLRLCKLEPKGNHKYQRASSAFAMVSGAFFLIAGTHQYLFSPNQSVESGMPMY